jgi:sugar/nucleoside kinase (ribokinase family)
MMPGKEKTIVVCGHLCLDVIPRFPASRGSHDWFRPGRLSIVESATIATGGAVSNVGISLHRLGLPVRLVAGIGDDPLGSLILAGVRGQGPALADDLAVLPGEATSYTVVLSPPGVDRIFLHCPGANDAFTGVEVPDLALDDASLFHFGYPPLMKQIWSDGGVRLLNLLTRARGRGSLTSLDMSLPDPSSPSGKADWGALLARVLPAVDIFVPSIEEILFMLDRQSFDRLSANGGGEAIIRGVTFDELDALARKILSSGVSAVLIKLGDRGAYLRTAENAFSSEWSGRELYSPCFALPRISGTTGAGDATIAGFLGSIVRGLDPASALRMAVAVGACCVEAPDATSGIRTWAETQARLSAGWSRVAGAHTEEGWTALEDGSWRGPRGR